MAGQFITGDRELDRKLAAATPEIRKAMWQALQQAGTVVLRAMRAHVPVRYKAAKRALDKRFKKATKKTEQVAKIGAGVGKRRPKPDRTGKAGVGISKPTIHWFILGTRHRLTRRKRPTGAMPAVLADVVRKGFKSADGAAQDKIRTVLRAKVAKLERGNV